jgi:hypothetical protein
VLLDSNYHNRELEILKNLRNTPGILNLKFYSKVDVNRFRECIKYLKNLNSSEIDFKKLSELDPSKHAEDCNLFFFYFCYVMLIN